MEVLQCDGCDFRAESYDDLKAHIQELHTAFLQPTDVGDHGSPTPSRSESLNSPNQTKEEDGEEEEGEDDEEEEKEETVDKEYKSSKTDNDSGHHTKPIATSDLLIPFFQCKFCIRYFRSKSFLTAHTRKVHGATLGDGDSQTDNLSKVFSCQYCTYKSPRKARLLKHQRMYHKEAAPPKSLKGLEESCSDPIPGLPVIKTKGTFSCQWCNYQTLRKDLWNEHVMNKHRKMLKTVSNLPEEEGEGSASSSKSDSPSSPRSSPNSDMAGNDASETEASSVLRGEVLEGSAPLKIIGGMAFQYSQIQSVAPNSTGSSILSERSTFAVSDVSSSAIDMDSSLLNDEEDSGSSSGDEDMDSDLNGTNASAEDSVKQLLSEEDSKMLETKGIPFRRYMNRFQCPFCSFLTMHRRSISRHIENIHLSGKTTVFKCDECPFICTSPLKLGTHKQSHSPDWDTMDLTSESPDHQNDASEPVNGGSVATAAAKVNGKKFSAGNDVNQQNPHRCTLCNFSTATLKGLRVHQQHKHSYCDDMDAQHTTGPEGSTDEQPDAELDSSLNCVQKTQTSILGLTSKKALTGKTARKSINDLPLDLSPVKKRTRIDEIANNLQSKISQSQLDMVINLEDMDEEEERAGENHIDADKEDNNLNGKNNIYAYNAQNLYTMSGSANSRVTGRAGKRKSHPKSKVRSLPVAVAVSDEEENDPADPKDLQDQSSQDSRDNFQEYTEETGVARFYCKHCDYHNKSARSVSTHYQRMHPYIKFSFRYILDPEDHSAVFRCLECYIEYTNYNDLHQHYMDHHPEASNVLNFNQPDLVYMCRFCSYTSPNVRSLMPHYQRMHPTVKINNAMIFSSYVVEQPQKGAESQTLREILNSGPKSLSSSSSSQPRSSPALKSISKAQVSGSDAELLKEAMGGNVVVYDCDVCSFASPNMHSVLVHYQKKHPEQKASYFRIQKAMRVISVDRPQPAANSAYNVGIATPSKSSASSPFGSDDEVYYCKHCVYSNRSVVGVLVHYQKRHPEIKVTAKYIKHAPPTPGLMKLMDELQIAPPKQFLKQLNSNGHDSSGNSQSRLGVERGEAEMLFFCQHCDYGNRTVKGVLIHYQKKHRDTKANADLVRRHTAVVRSQRERAQMVQSCSTPVVTPAPVDPDTSGTLRALKCKLCSYTSPYVYALKKHLKKDHPTVKATAMTILHWAYQEGILEAGYHCEWCIYSHAEPNGLLLHYQRRHPEHNVDYTYMASKLWAGPDTTAAQPGNQDAKHYRCRDCAFEACSIWEITNHYQAIHPWAIKGDETIILDIIKENGSPDKQDQLMAKSPATTFVYQTLQEDGALDISTTPQDLHQLQQQQHASPHPRLSSISNNPYQCTVCLSEYNSLHGLLTHYGKKHPGMKVKAADFAQEADINPSSVYKCRHCPYVNSRIHGVLTHYQKRHPLVKVTAEDFADDIEHIKDLSDAGEDKCKTQRQGYGAYRCKMCPYTHGTLEKLKIHYEKYHNQPATDIFTPSLAHFSASREDPVAECSAASVMTAGVSGEVQELSDYDLALSQFPINKTEKHSIFRCQLCKYFCSTRKGIARHYRIKHNNVRAQPEGKNNVFKCALCAYTNPIRKGLAAHYQKRHDIDAYYTHCLAASKTLGEKPAKVVLPVSSDGDGAELSEDLKLAVERRKCSLCGFQAFSRKSIVSHYIKRHPGVFPKKQHASKLGRYFTVIYAEEPEKTAAEEDKEGVIEVQPEPVPEEEAEWLPFKCLKCFRLSFGTTEMLSEHYNSHHGKDLRRDFVIQASPEEDGAELYQCAHCEQKFLGLPELGKHLMNHNEEFQKRAMRQERRRQLLSKQKAAEPPESKAEKESAVNKGTPIGFRCNFCVEVHPTLRAICNHLRKHVQYGEVKEGHIKQEAAEVQLSPPLHDLTNGEVKEEEEAALGAADGMTPPPPPLPATLPAVGGALDAMETAAAVMALPSVAAAVMAMPSVAAEAPGGGGKGRLVAGGHHCAQCDRVFMSMQGLRSHERSHSAVALFSRDDKYSCQFCQFASPFRHNLDRHVQSHHAHHKPFRCKLCPFKSAYLSRLKSHLHKAHAGENTYKCLSCSFSSSTIIHLKEHSLRNHGEPLTLPKIRAATQAAVLTVQRLPRLDSDPELAPLPSGPDDPAYMEPADVRQQLTHYQLAARSQVTAGGGGHAHEGRHDGGAALTCEFCEFSSGYMQSLRRHYRDRHGGKKLFKCKDCSYFTCYKSTFTLHVKAGHASVVEEGPKDLRCPLCLYHTKQKSSMIDHIVLHREERVAPLEVSRSKLSRHLQGLVFRCHKCTFTCSSDRALQQHLRKHDELKPYQCQLCYYDCRHKHQLEEHLRSEHKVIRNFELMGRVNLDQLEVMRERGSSVEDEKEREEDDEDEEEEEEEGEAAVAEQEAVRREVEERRDMLEEQMEEGVGEEEEEEEEEEGAEHEEEEADKPGPQEAPACPSSSGLAACGERKLPCEFCGRCFTDSLEWERHVLRHGMTINNTVTNPSCTPAIDASAPPLIGSADMTDSVVDLSGDGVEADLSQSHNPNEEDKEMLETKNDQ